MGMFILEILYSYVSLHWSQSVYKCWHRGGPVDSEEQRVIGDRRDTGSVLSPLPRVSDPPPLVFPCMICQRYKMSGAQGGRSFSGGASSSYYSANKKESVLDLGKFIDKKVQVKLQVRKKSS